VAAPTARNIPRRDIFPGMRSPDVNHLPCGARIPPLK